MILNDDKNGKMEYQCIAPDTFFQGLTKNNMVVHGYILMSQPMGGRTQQYVGWLLHCPNSVGDIVQQGAPIETVNIDICSYSFIVFHDG